MLRVSNLEIHYGEICAADGISISVSPGDIVSISGPNGSGKSSVLNAITGIHPIFSGEIYFQGANITRLSAHQIVKKGIAQVPEGRQLFATLTVRENLLAGRYSSEKFFLTDALPETILERFPMLQDCLDLPGSSLSGGQAQMLALARGLMMKPKLLLLDEPTLGLAPIAVIEIFDLIVELKNQGLTVLVVEQNVRQTLEISDYGYILESGRIVMEGEGFELLKNSELVTSYLGTTKPK